MRQNLLFQFRLFRLNEQKAIELENQLKKLVTAFSARTKKTKAKIRQPPTPSSTESESGKYN